MTLSAATTTNYKSAMAGKLIKGQSFLAKDLDKSNDLKDYGAC